MAENWTQFDPKVDQEDTDLAIRVARLGFSPLQDGTGSFAIFKHQELS
jgi:hypothetical protein